MNYQEAAAYIESIPKFTSKTTLEHTEHLLDELGHPEREMKIFHVAGTNGKGSVCAYLCSMLMEGGYRVGLFTSPHLIRVNERFMINREPVSDEKFLWAFETVMKAVKKTVAKGEVHPTYFETLFLMGLLLFQREKTDYVILEVGMGGRLDATNVIRKPLVSVITSISLDHTEYLGNTISAIAGEKAGIIKKGVPVVYDGHVPEAAEVIAKKAEELGTDAYALEPSMYQVLHADREGLTFLFQPESQTAAELRIPHIAEYQMMNAALAFFAMRLLSEEHRISEEKLIRGIAGMVWPCRMETVMPGVVIDGAHNEDGVAEFVRTAARFHENHEVTILFSAVADKRYPDMIREIEEGIHPEHVVTMPVPGRREVSAQILAELFRQSGSRDVRAEETIGQAFEKAYALKGDGMLFCVGSLYLAGMVKAWINSRKDKMIQESSHAEL